MIRSIVFDPEGTDEFDDAEVAKDAPGTTWTRITDPSPSDIETVTRVYDIHSLAVEDVQDPDTRPKVEEYDEHTFVLIKTAALRRGDVTFAEELRVQTVGVFIGEGWLVTLSPEETDAVERVWQGALTGDRRLHAKGPDFTAYRVLDAVVDDYFKILDDIETQIEGVEEAVIDSPDVTTLERINELRRDLLSVRRLLWPSRDGLSLLARGDPEQIREETEKYYRDVYDHLVQLVDMTETYRDLVVGTRDIYLNSLSVSTNEVMKKLTVVATIILPLTFVVGVYGMNFEGSPYNMPELAWTYGYPAVLLGMGVVSVILLGYF
ncbi:MAG: magnesium/cobalt transporter CorA, partial [Halodesulfurarchaeum sp.]